MRGNILIPLASTIVLGCLCYNSYIKDLKEYRCLKAIEYIDSCKDLTTMNKVYDKWKVISEDPKMSNAVMTIENDMLKVQIDDDEIVCTKLNRLERRY